MLKEIFVKLKEQFRIQFNSLYFGWNVFGLIVVTIDHLEHEGRELSSNLHFHGMGSDLNGFSGLLIQKI